MAMNSGIWPRKRGTTVTCKCPESGESISYLNSLEEPPGDTSESPGKPPGRRLVLVVRSRLGLMATKWSIPLLVEPYVKSRGFSLPCLCYSFYHLVRSVTQGQAWAEGR